MSRSGCDQVWTDGSSLTPTPKLNRSKSLRCYVRWRLLSRGGAAARALESVRLAAFPLRSRGRRFGKEILALFNLLVVRASVLYCNTVSAAQRRVSTLTYK